MFKKLILFLCLFSSVIYSQYDREHPEGVPDDDDIFTFTKLGVSIPEDTTYKIRKDNLAQQINYWLQSGSDLYYSAGNVGINKSVPTTKLHIVGSSLSGLSPFTGTDLTIDDGGGVIISLLGGNTSTQAIVYGKPGDNIRGLFEYTNIVDAFIWGTAGIPNRMFLSSEGKLGINTNSPDSLLTVDGGGHITGDLKVDGLVNGTDLSNVAFTNTVNVFSQNQNYNGVDNFFAGAITWGASGTFRLPEYNFGPGEGWLARTTSPSSNALLLMTYDNAKIDTMASYRYLRNEGIIGADIAYINQVNTFTTNQNFDSYIIVDGNIFVADDNFVGLGAGSGRIEYDNQATDEVNILNANVGIGTSTPDSTLTVSGSGHFTEDLQVDGLINGVQEYVAILNQTGTNDPVATVIKNDVGSIVWTRTGTGGYIGTLIGAFPADKTFFIVTYGSQQGTETHIEVERNDANEVQIEVFDNSHTQVDGFGNLNYKIEIYP
jgi:uncharacterized protein (UPF0333 family)